jgi:hypothetical protein
MPQPFAIPVKCENAFTPRSFTAALKASGIPF